MVVGALSGPVHMASYAKVERGFEGEPSIGRKRPLPAASGYLANESAQRQKRWMLRHSKHIGFGSWRPKRIHRLKSNHWLMMVDTQFRASTGLEGLKLFILDNSPLWASPFRWPYLALAQDLGSGNSGYHALERHWGGVRRPIQ